jgi:hypothetical protein
MEKPKKYKQMVVTKTIDVNPKKSLSHQKLPQKVAPKSGQNVPPQKNVM